LATELAAHETPRSHAADAVQIARFALLLAVDKGHPASELCALGAVYVEAVRELAEIEVTEATEYVAKVLGESRHGE
jgi:hypothetical protein